MLLNKRHVIATWRLALKYPHSPDIFFKRRLTSKPPITFTFYPCVFLFCVSCASFLLVLRSLYSFSSFLCFFSSLFSVFFWFQARLQLFLYSHRVLQSQQQRESLHVSYPPTILVLHHCLSDINLKNAASLFQSSLLPITIRIHYTSLHTWYLG